MSDELTTIRSKSDYVTKLIQDQQGLKNNDNKAFLYLYDIVKFLVRRKTNTQNMSSDIPEEIIQNIVVQVSQQFSIHNENYKGLSSIFAYVGKCVSSELCKLDRNKYRGQSYIKSGYNLDNENDFTGEFSFNHTYEMESILHIEKMLGVIIREATYLLDENIVPVENKHLLLFPLLVAIAREEEKIINKFDIRVRTVLKQIYKDVGSPLERMK